VNILTSILIEKQWLLKKSCPEKFREFRYGFKEGHSKDNYNLTAMTQA
jgi:hypothetical protein